MIKLKKLLSENLLKEANTYDAQTSMEDLLKRMRPKIGKLKFTFDPMTGTWSWVDDKKDIWIHATWGWEGYEGVIFEDHDGDVIKKQKYKSSGDPKKDVKWYISTCKRYLPGIYKDLLKKWGDE